MSFAKNRGVRLAYDVLGAGPDLLLIAGTSADRALWAQVRPALSEKFRTIAFDNRDSGASIASPRDYGMASWWTTRSRCLMRQEASGRISSGIRSGA